MTVRLSRHSLEEAAAAAGGAITARRVAALRSPSSVTVLFAQEIGSDAMYSPCTRDIVDVVTEGDE